MPDFVSANLIQSVVPNRYATDVLTNQPIVVGFFRDIDDSTLTSATVALQVVGTLTRLPVTLSYSNKVLTITPTGGLEPGTNYQLTLIGDADPDSDILTSNITGIKDIVGNGFIGSFVSTFSTSDAITPAIPLQVAPVDQASVLVQPTFIWTAASGASTYEIQVSTANTFEVIYWPINETWNSNLTSVTPAKPFLLNQDYWWRVRGIGNTGIPGDWSTVTTFYFGDPTLGVVTPDDAPLGGVGVTQIPYQVLFTNPAPGTANIQGPDYPSEIRVVIQGIIDPGTITSSALTIKAASIDGTTFDANNFTPIWSPVLNGDQFGSGGITAEQAVDQYQRIYVSPPLKSLVVRSTNDGTNTTLWAEIPGDYWNQNNIYTVTLTLPQIAQPVQWTFSSAYSPVFCGVAEVRSETDHFMPDASDDELLFHIRDNSLEALRIQVYPPTQIDGQRWIYNPPVSFNVNNPPYFARKYVRLATARDLLGHYFTQLLGQGRTQLGDFQMDREMMALKQNIQAAIAGFDEEIMPYLDQLHGLTNRGYARGEWATRSEPGHFSGPNGYPFGLRPRGTTF